jgi:hypothetical protein
MCDADMENTETQVSLDFAETCKYISKEEYQEILYNSEEIGRMLNHMVENPEKYCPKHKTENMSIIANCSFGVSKK